MRVCVYVYIQVDVRLPGKGKFKIPRRETGPPNRHDDKVVSGQQVVNKELYFYEPRDEPASVQWHARDTKVITVLSHAMYLFKGFGKATPPTKPSTYCFDS